MLSVNTQRYLRMLVEIALFALATLGVLVVLSVVQAQTPARRAPQRPQAAAPAPAPQETPVFRDYRGVTVGASMQDVRARLGQPAEAQNRQDFYVFSAAESVQIFYDAQNAVMGLSINYLGEGSGAPTPEQVLGSSITPNADGSLYKVVRYEGARFWVAYSRTAGEQPLVTIALQRIVN